MLLGLKDPVIFLAYLLTVLSSVGCVVYGVINWNKGAAHETEEIKEEAEWEKDEKKIEDNL